MNIRLFFIIGSGVSAILGITIKMVSNIFVRILLFKFRSLYGYSNRKRK
jgi:hypothetical protein